MTFSFGLRLRLLLAEDDAMLTDALATQPGQAGFVVEHAPNGEDTPVGKLTARVPGNVHQHAGDAVHLQWDAAQAQLIAVGSGLRVG